MIRGDTLILQKHFRINNTIRSDRFHESEYIDDLKKLFIKDNGAYTEDETKGIAVNGSQLVYQAVTNVDTEDKLSKDKLSKDNINNTIKPKVITDKPNRTHEKNDDDDLF